MGGSPDLESEPDQRRREMNLMGEFGPLIGRVGGLG
jgi:hypothetical protein